MIFQKFDVIVRQRRQQFVGRQRRNLGIQNAIPPGRSGPFSAGMNVAFRVDASTAMLLALSELASWRLFGIRQKRRTVPIYPVGSATGDTVGPPLSNSIACVRQIPSA
jgi:hypothetical protein